MRIFLRTAFLLILAYLALIHFTGFSKDVSTLTAGTGELVKDFQGRG
jgi:translation elongation factor EF-G